MRIEIRKKMCLKLKQDSCFLLYASTCWCLNAFPGNEKALQNQAELEQKAIWLQGSVTPLYGGSLAETIYLSVEKDKYTL